MSISLFRSPSLLALALYTGLASPTFAQQVEAGTLEGLRAELQALKAEQAERDRRIQRLEAALSRIDGGLTTPEALPPSSPPPGQVATPAQPSATTAAVAIAGDDRGASRWKVSGDLRLRGQGDGSDDDGKDRGSMQVRGRLGATFTASDRLVVGARLATGDGDDPNSTDVQLSNWVDDLEVSLDQAYLQYTDGGLTLLGGKFANPFVRTDLVWDGDVNPQGLGMRWRRPLPGGGALRANALAFIVDESAGGSDSTMLGAQFGFDAVAGDALKFDANLAYYHYSLGSLAGADSGDFRSNLRKPDGSYLSDFHLANLLLGASWSGIGERWPLRVTVDYVRNLGAATDADTGYGVDLSLGRASSAGDWRVTLGSSVAQTDAVLAAFSHDNIGIATNYRLHGLTVDYVPVPRTLLSAYWYHYRPYGALDAGPNQPGDWLERLRLAFMVSF